MSNKPWQAERDKLVEMAAKLKRQFKAKTKNQQTYLGALENKTVVVCVGPAGTGKTWMACGYATRQLKEEKVERLIITRPIVPCGRGYGFRPGTAQEKVLPDMRPMLDALTEFFGIAELNRRLQDRSIEILPLDDMRGCSLPRTIILCDESQNAEFNQLHMLLTRFGEDSQVILTGDVSRTQTDLRNVSSSPLAEVISRFEPAIHRDVAIVRLGREDIVRHPLIGWIDERLTEGPPEESRLDWVDLKCPKCKSPLWYAEDLDDEPVDQVRCYRCVAHIDLYEEDDDWAPHPAAVNEKGAATTYPQRP